METPLDGNPELSGIPGLAGGASRPGATAFNDYVLVALCEWLQMYGLNRDCPGMLEMFLKNRFPACEAEVDVLVCAFRMGVPGDLAWNPAGEPRPFLFEKLRKRLRAGCGMTLGTAGWAVENWGIAVNFTGSLKAG